MKKEEEKFLKEQQRLQKKKDKFAKQQKRIEDLNIKNKAREEALLKKTEQTAIQNQIEDLEKKLL